MEKKILHNDNTLKLKEEDRDLWLKKMGERPSMKPEDEPFSWMEYFDLMDAYRN